MRPPFESTPWNFQFNITAPVAGVYPIRLVYWTQDSNSGLEFSQQNQLVNSDGATVVFRESTAPHHSHAYIAEVSPVPGVADISPEEPITILLRDDKTTVNTQSVKLSFNGVDITGQATVSSGNGRTTINYQPPPARQSDRNELVLEYLDSSGQSFTREWSFANSLGEKPPMVTGQWDFSNGLRATIGSDLLFNDEVSESDTLFGTTTSFEIADIGGEPAGGHVCAIWEPRRLQIASRHCSEWRWAICESLYSFNGRHEGWRRRGFSHHPSISYEKPRRCDILLAGR
jgi:hypothetical protein